VTVEASIGEEVVEALVDGSADVEASDGPEGTTAAGDADLGVLVRISGAPAEVRIQVDGEDVRNPFRVPAGGGPHRLRLTARGYSNYNDTFEATEDLVLPVRMARVSGGAVGTSDAGGAADTGRSGQLLPDPHLFP
jgi:hypothetical protein